VRLEAGEKKRREMGTKGPRTPPTIRAISECGDEADNIR